MGPIAFSGFQDSTKTAEAQALQAVLERQISDLGIRITQDISQAPIVIVNGDELTSDIKRLSAMAQTPKGEFRVAVLGKAEIMPDSYRNHFPGGALYIQKPIFPPDLWRVLRERPARVDVAEQGDYVTEPNLSEMAQGEPFLISEAGDVEHGPITNSISEASATTAPSTVLTSHNTRGDQRQTPVPSKVQPVLVVEDNPIASPARDSGTARPHVGTLGLTRRSLTPPHRIARSSYRC